MNSAITSFMNGVPPFSPRRTDLPTDPLCLEEFLQRHGFNSIFPIAIDLHGDPRGPQVSISELHHLCRAGQSTDISSIPSHGVIENSDGRIVVDVEGVYALPGYHGVAVGFGDLIDPLTLQPLPTCFRRRLKDMCKLAADKHNIGILSGLETEFFMHKTGTSLEEKYVPGIGPRGNYQRLPHQWPDFDVVQKILEGLAAANLPVTVAHSEVSWRQFEINTEAADPIRAAQDFMILRMGLPRLAKEQGYEVVFTAKPLEGRNGSGEHTHISAHHLGSKENALFKEDRSFTEIGAWFFGGLYHAAPALTFLGNTDPRDYRRLVAIGNEAPNGNCLGWSNRTCSERLTGNTHRNFHVEFRAPSPSGVHAFGLLIGMLGAVMFGIENKITPPELVKVNAYEFPDTKGVGRLPQSFEEAQQAFRESEAMKFAFTNEQFEALANMKPVN